MNDFESINSEIFVPGLDREKYQLFYGPLNVYMFLVYFYSVYERVLKAKQLVEQKVIQDFKDDFSYQEWFQKFK